MHFEQGTACRAEELIDMAARHNPLALPAVARELERYVTEQAWDCFPIQGENFMDAAIRDQIRQLARFAEPQGTVNATKST